MATANRKGEVFLACCYDAAGVDEQTVLAKEGSFAFAIDLALRWIAEPRPRHRSAEVWCGDHCVYHSDYEADFYLRRTHRAINAPLAPGLYRVEVDEALDLVTYSLIKPGLGR